MIFRRKKQNRRGFTLAETVIALAIIATVSVASVSLVLTAQNASMAALQKQQAQFYAADIVSCYRAEKEDGDFEKNLAFAFDLNPDSQVILSNLSLPNGMAADIDRQADYIKVIIYKGNKVLYKLTFGDEGGTL